MARKDGRSHPDLFEWADSLPETSVSIAPTIEKSKTAMVIDRVAFFRQRKKFFLAIFYGDEKALLRPVSGELINITDAIRRRASASCEDAGDAKTGAA